MRFNKRTTIHVDGHDAADIRRILAKKHNVFVILQTSPTMANFLSGNFSCLSHLQVLEVMCVLLTPQFFFEMSLLPRNLCFGVIEIILAVAPAALAAGQLFLPELPTGKGSRCCRLRYLLFLTEADKLVMETFRDGKNGISIFLRSQ